MKSNAHCNCILQYHYNKHGKDSLVFSVVELCDRDKLIEREQLYIDTLNPEFNICKIAASVLGIKRSEETKKKMSVAMKGRNLSNNHKMNLSESHSGKKLTVNHKKKISNALKGKGVKAIFSIDEFGIRTDYSSTKEASIFIGVDYRNFKRYVINNNRSKNGLQWHYV
jgi:group I intron endonuclease